MEITVSQPDIKQMPTLAEGIVTRPDPQLVNESLTNQFQVLEPEKDHCFLHGPISRRGSFYFL